MISELASHPTYSGILLTATGPGNMVQVGPFFDGTKLRMWLQEMALRLSPTGLYLMPDLKGHDLRLLVTQKHYLDVLQAWWSKYPGLNVANVGPRITPA